jgi:UDP-N-acetylglucosamine 2-epimerase (non-hydrolysing)
MIVAEIARLLDDPHAYQSMSTPSNLYGDGKASQRILQALQVFRSSKDSVE